MQALKTILEKQLQLIEEEIAKITAVLELHQVNPAQPLPRQTQEVPKVYRVEEIKRLPRVFQKLSDIGYRSPEKKTVHVAIPNIAANDYEKTETSDHVHINVNTPLKSEDGPVQESVLPSYSIKDGLRIVSAAKQVLLTLNNQYININELYDQLPTRTKRLINDKNSFQQIVKDLGSTAGLVYDGTKVSLRK